MKTSSRALEQAAGSKKIITAPKVEIKHKFWLGTYLLLLFGFGAIYYLLRFDYFNFQHFAKYAENAAPFQRPTLGGMAVVLVLMITGAIKIY